MQKTLIPFIPLLLALSLYAGAATAGDIVVSIKPLHSLVQGVIGDTTKAELLIEGDLSPHGLSLRPSQLKMLHNAKVIFYIDAALESFLLKTFESLSLLTRKIAVAKNPQLTLLKQRGSDSWEAHGHRSHDHHEHDRLDMHLWLDTGNAQKIVAAVSEDLAAIYPENRDIYRQNARTLSAKIEALDAEMRQRLVSFEDKPFVVFHDAYQYFERRYGLNGVGAITLEPSDMLSINRLKQIREKIQSTEAICVFHEPQFPAESSKKLQAAIHGSNAKISMLDPLGADLTPGAGLYLDLLENLANNFIRCLS